MRFLGKFQLPRDLLFHYPDSQRAGRGAFLFRISSLLQASLQHKELTPVPSLALSDSHRREGPSAPEVKGTAQRHRAIPCPQFPHHSLHSVASYMFPTDKFLACLGLWLRSPSTIDLRISFIDADIEAQRGLITCLSMHS